MEKGVLVLRDGTVVSGAAFGSFGECEGEVVFTTSMTGYQEYLTDPSYRYQILMPTYPLIGNYGVDSVMFESDRIQVEGFVVGELCEVPSHFKIEKKLDDWLTENDIPAIQGVDTRYLTRKIRVHGVIEGILKTPCSEREIPDLVSKAKELKPISEMDLVGLVSTKKTIVHKPKGKSKKRVVLIDVGTKQSIIRNFVERGVELIQVPHNTSSKKILEHDPDGVMVSNGPGDPKKLTTVHKSIRAIVDSQVPLFGICFGNQLLAHALGGDTKKLKFGHRGANQPVKDLKTGRVYVTSQNHGFVVDPDSLEGTGLKVSHINLNDGTVEGLVHDSLPVASVQYHPEAHPGPWDTYFLFDEFVGRIK